VQGESEQTDGRLNRENDRAQREVSPRHRRDINRRQEADGARHNCLSVNSVQIRRQHATANSRSFLSLAFPRKNSSIGCGSVQAILSASVTGVSLSGRTADNLPPD
jgi:hypothetical protein